MDLSVIYGITDLATQSNGRRHLHHLHGYRRGTRMVRHAYTDPPLQGRKNTTPRPRPPGVATLARPGRDLDVPRRPSLVRFDGRRRVGKMAPGRDGRRRCVYRLVSVPVSLDLHSG